MFMINDASAYSSSRLTLGYISYLTIFGLFVEIWTVCSLEEAHGNGKS